MTLYLIMEAACVTCMTELQRRRRRHRVLLLHERRLQKQEMEVGLERKTD